MTALPSLSEAQIRARTSAASWSRGEGYFSAGNVLRIVWREGTLFAEVAGSDVEPYRVRVFFDQQGNLLDAQCSCPYQGYGDCKHIVATLLYLLRRPEEVEQRPSLYSLLASLNRDQLLELFRCLERENPDLIESVEAVLPSLTEAMPPNQTAVDLRMIQSRTKQQVRRIGKEAYTKYIEDWDEIPWLSDALAPALQQVESFLQNQDPRTALLILEAATQGWVEGVHDLNKSFVQDVLCQEEEGLFALDAAWSDALLRADLSLEERQTWEQKLRAWQRQIPVEGVLEMPVVAVQQGWDQPLLVAAMGGHITEKGVWEADVPDFADDLATIRLNILKERGQIEAYLNLAQAEGQHLAYVQMLVELGRSEEALSEAKALLQSHDEILLLSRALSARGEAEKAVQLAAHGLTLKPARSFQRVDLALWLRDEAARLGYRDLALQAGWEVFQERPSLQNYCWLKEYLGEEWSSHAARALEIAEKSTDFLQADQVIEIYLHEQMHEQAMALVERLPFTGKLLEVIEAVRESHPRWAFTQCLSRAEAIMDGSRSSEYEEAVEWLRRGRAILLQAGLQAEWHTVLNRLLERHQKKRKLYPMLEGLR